MSIRSRRARMWMTPPIIAIALVAFLGLIGVRDAPAFETWESGCSAAACHNGVFAGGTGNAAHDAHRVPLGTSCNPCHATDFADPAIPDCTGCHVGPGLRQHHRVAAVSTCAPCHGNPEVGGTENTVPPGYAGTNLNPCDGSEDLANFDTIATESLDNDGDGLKDAADPDCAPPTPEDCFNGVDDDGDNLIDCADTTDCEGALGAATSCGVGACASTGNETCAGGVLTDTCTAGNPTAEVCDNIDNDCDNTVDDGIAPVPSTCGVGACASTGQQTCVNGVFVDSCQPGTPSAEVCTGSIDEDCDNQVDCADSNCTNDLACIANPCAGFVPQPTTCGVGACASTGTTTCTPVNGQAQIGDTCQPGTPTAEVCNQIDDDCDDQVDEGGVCVGPDPCDVDGDGDVDRNDITLIFAARGQTVPPADAALDINNSGKVTILDTAACVIRCTRANCATE